MMFSSRIINSSRKAFTKPTTFNRCERKLHLHEYQGKELMNKFGVATEKFGAAGTPAEAEQIARNLNVSEYIVKAQVFAGGRGLGTFTNGFKGGVHTAKSPEEVRDIASKMLGNRLVTKQTGKDGVPVNVIMVSSKVAIKKENYFAIFLDRASAGPIMIVSTKGGIHIENAAEETPDEIYVEKINIFTGPTEQQLDILASNLQLEGTSAKKFKEQAQKLYNMFIKTDATQVEINPLVVTEDGNIAAVDAKLNFDDNSEFRQKRIFAMEDKTEDDPREVLAQKLELSYVGMTGNIGCMVNGAGLAMATMDIIKYYNGEPANFLDVGGGADERRVTEAFKLITSDPRVKVILVNIFGGIVKCDLIAQGIISACNEVHVHVPVVVRLAGTNVDQGYALLKKSGLEIITADDLDDAAIKATDCLKH